MAISTISLSERDFTREPWDTYPWPGFDSLANDLDIGRYSLPPVGEMSDQTAQYLWEAPVAVTRRAQVLNIFVKWAGFCPCFNSAANKIALGRTSMQALQAQLKSQGYRTTSRLPDDEIVLLDADFVDNWRHNFYATNPQLEQWKANRVRLDVGELRCSCAPAVRNHHIIPPFQSPEGWTIRPQPVAVPWEAFFWPDPDA